MENLNIAIVSRNEAYNRALAMSLIKVCHDMNIETWDSLEFVNRWAEYKGKGKYYDRFDMVLWAGEEIKDSYGDNIVYLTAKSSLVNKDYHSNRFSVYMYCSATSLLAEIFDIYTHLTGRNAPFLRRSLVRLIGFASCRGGAGCTAVAMATGHEYVRFHGKRVLYISMEDVESTGEYIHVPPGSRRIGEFLYRLLAHRKINEGDNRQTMPFTEGYTVRSPYGLEAFAPARGKNPLRELNVDEVQKFIAALMDCGHYDIIIVDLSSCLTESAIGVMELATAICYISQGEVWGERDDSYIRQIICAGGQDIISKIVGAKNMCEKKNEETKTDDGKTLPSYGECTIRRSHIDYSDCNEYLFDRETGQDIRELASKLAGPIRGFDSSKAKEEML